LAVSFSFSLFLSLFGFFLTRWFAAISFWFFLLLFLSPSGFVLSCFFFLLFFFLFSHTPVHFSREVFFFFILVFPSQSYIEVRIENLFTN
jgi:hypothetical protein